MRRFATIVVVGLVGGPVLAAGAGAQEAATASAGSASARLVRCHPSLWASGRFLAVDAQMAAYRGVARMAMRFELLRRKGGSSRFVLVRGPGLGVWRRSDRGIARFRYHKRIENLSAPAAYRVIVGFRWSNARGRVIRRARRETAICRQPDLRPDLRIRRIDVLPPDPDHPRTRYVAVVRNAGRTAAGGFDVTFTPGGASVPARTARVDRLGAGAVVRVRWAGPPCSAASPPRVDVDPRHEVDESREGNNSRMASCG